ncbi:MAG: hypothetical protein IPP78_08560 [Holophagaceae bacterium]|nr:hypothetical protein [Holophagaceae bacterium]
MIKQLHGFLAIWCVLLLTGCLDYGQQTLTYRYDAKSDTLRIFQVYQGIFGEDQPAGLSSKELDQLQSVLVGQRTFFFANWILEYNRDEVSNSLDRLTKPNAQQDAKRDPVIRSRQEAFLKLLLDNIRVENGAFYLDGQGRLCGTQFVSVKQFSKLAAAANVQIQDFLKAEAVRENVSVEEHDLFLKSIEQPQTYIAVEGNQIRLRLPMTRAAFEKTYGPKSGSTKQLDEFKRQGGTFAFADNEMKWSIGKPLDHTTELTLSVSDKPYVSNALSEVKRRTVVREKMDLAAVSKAFIWGTNTMVNPSKP